MFMQDLLDTLASQDRREIPDHREVREVRDPVVSQDRLV